MTLHDRFSAALLGALFAEVLCDTMRRAPNALEAWARPMAAARVRRHMASEFERLEELALAHESLTPSQAAYLERMYAEDSWQPWRELAELGGSRTILLDLDEPMAAVPVDEPFVIRAVSAPFDSGEVLAFDALAWVERAGDDDLVALATRRWVLPQDVARGLVAECAPGAPADADSHLDERTACAWLSANRPSAWAAVLALRSPGKRSPHTRSHG